MRQLGADGGKQNGFFFAGGLVQHRLVFFGLLAQVHEHGGVAAVVQDHVRAFAGRAFSAKFKDAVGVVPVVGQRLAFDGKHRRAVGGNGSSSMVLGAENIARCPAHLGAKRFQRFDQHSGLDRHVQRTGDACALERLLRCEFFADGHQAGHLGLSDADFFTAPVGQADVSDGAVDGKGNGGTGVHERLQKQCGYTTRVPQARGPSHARWMSVVAERDKPGLPSLTPKRCWDAATLLRRGCDYTGANRRRRSARAIAPTSNAIENATSAGQRPCSQNQPPAEPSTLEPR